MLFVWLLLCRPPRFVPLFTNQKGEIILNTVWLLWDGITSTLISSFFPPAGGNCIYVVSSRTKLRTFKWRNLVYCNMVTVGVTFGDKTRLLSICGTCVVEGSEYYVLLLVYAVSHGDWVPKAGSIVWNENISSSGHLLIHRQNCRLFEFRSQVCQCDGQGM